LSPKTIFSVIGSVLIFSAESFYFHLSKFLGGAEVGKNLTGKADLKHK
jgi:hypothetical protein